MSRLRPNAGMVSVVALGACMCCLSAALMLALPAATFAEESAVPAGISEQVESLGDLLPAGGTGTTNPAGRVIGQVEKVAFGSQGATVTLEGGKQIRLDFSGLTGVSGGPNYVGWAMVLFGMSVATRLLSSLARVLRPITRVSNASRMARRARYDDDDY